MTSFLIGALVGGYSVHHVYRSMARKARDFLRGK